MIPCISSRFCPLPLCYVREMERNYGPNQGADAPSYRDASKKTLIPSDAILTWNFVPGESILELLSANHDVKAYVPKVRGGIEK